MDIKWIEILDQCNGAYNKNKDIKFNDLCDFNDAYIVVTGKITATNPGNDANQLRPKNKQSNN